MKSRLNLILMSLVGIVFTFGADSRVVAQDAPQNNKTVTIYFYRVKSTFDTSFNPVVIIDGMEVAGLEKNQAFGMHLSAGEHRIELFGRFASENRIVLNAE